MKLTLVIHTEHLTPQILSNPLIKTFKNVLNSYLLRAIKLTDEFSECAYEYVCVT